jgi:hypothetical protein
MPIDKPKYDVAISFLSKDSHTAAALYDKLGEGLNVFFFPGKQEDLAGTDGLKSMREPFYDNSRVNVVLYSDGWGKTPWTRVEETAIKDGCLAFGWRRLFFLVLDQSIALPVWLPDTHVRFNFAEYGLEQAVGAIKARVQENGGKSVPLTPAKRAEMLLAEEQYLQDKARMNSQEGLNKIVTAVRRLFDEIERQCNDLNSSQRAVIRCESVFSERSATQTCVITNDAVTVTVVWNQPYTNTLEGTGLVVREFKDRLILPSETNRYYIDQPRKDRETLYLPDLSLAREYGWKQEENTEFFSSEALAEKCVISLLDLSSRAMKDRRQRNR